MADQPVPAEPRGLRAEEWRAGIGRLGVAAMAVLMAVLGVSIVFLLLGADGPAALAGGAGVVGIVLVLAGLVAFTRTSIVRRDRGAISMTSAEDRREAEALALGLFGSGIAILLLALALG